MIDEKNNLGFRKLLAWQRADDLAFEIYRITKTFPAEEKFCLVPQIRRAALSVPANIVEGYSRNSKNDKVHFYNIALGSLNELEYFIDFAKRLGYISQEDYTMIINLFIESGRLLSGLSKGALRWIKPSKALFTLFLVPGLLFLVSPVSAASPAENPLCWTEDSCKKTDGEFCNDDKKCLGQEKQCSGEWGFCYPKLGTISVPLQVPIGGLTQIPSATDYIRTIYQVSLGIAVTAAIIVIMVAGFRWMTAAGNASIIGQAKTMILGAIIGLLLLFGASLLFQTINPDIVKLTLPRVPKLRPQSLTQTTWCDQLFKSPDEVKRFAYANEAPNLKKPEDMKAADFKEKTRNSFSQSEDGKCGKGYYSLDNTTQACFGRYCSDQNKVCVQSENNKFECSYALLAGNISFPIGRDVNVVRFAYFCKDIWDSTAFISGDVETLSDGKQRYIFKRNLLKAIKEDAGTRCSVRGGLKGLALQIRVNAVGFDDWYFVAKKGLNCSTRLTGVKDPYVSNVSSSDLFQLADFGEDKSLRCDIDVASLSH